MMTEAGWTTVVTIIVGGAVSIMQMYSAYRTKQLEVSVKENADKVGQVVAKTEVVSQKIEETKGKMEETKGKMDETIKRLNGGVTQLLEETQLRARAEGKAEAKAEAEIAAVELIRVNRIEWEKQTKDKAIADALVKKTADDKAQLDKMEQALIDSEAQRALQTSKTEALAEKKASAPTSSTKVLEADVQNVELHVAGTMTEGEKDAREKEPVKKREEEKK